MRDVWLILHFIGIAMGPGLAFAMLVLWWSNRQLPPAERAGLQRLTASLGIVGPFGLLLLIVSGFGLAWPAFSGLLKLPLFHLKLTLVFLLFAFVGYSHMHRARSRRASSNGKPTPLPAWLVPVPFILGTLTIITAVMIFH